MHGSVGERASAQVDNQVTDGSAVCVSLLEKQKAWLRRHWSVRGRAAEFVLRWGRSSVGRALALQA